MLSPNTHHPCPESGSPLFVQGLKWQLLTHCIVVGLLLVASSGCSVVLATRQPPKRDMAVLNPGAPRTLVLSELGEPMWTDDATAGRTDIFVFTQGYTKGVKTARALFHGAADVLTLGLWEVVGTPVELLADGRLIKAEVVYDTKDRIEYVRFFQAAKASQANASRHRMASVPLSVSY